MGSDAPSGSGQGGSTLYNWKDLLPPWTQAGQRVALPWVINQAFSGGMTPMEEKDMWSGYKSDIDTAASGARKDIANRWVGGGAALNSPAYNTAQSAVDIDTIGQTRKAASDFAKVKLGAKSDAVKNMLTGLYTQPPSATGSWSTQSSSGGGGGK